MKSKLWTLVILSLIAVSCTPKAETPLPILGHKDVDANGDTLYHTIPSFEFVNQDSGVVTDDMVRGKINVVDFFFTSCPTICPKMKKNMLDVYDAFKDNDSVVILSHTIDFRHDTVEVLRDYAEKLGVSTDGGWHFLYGVRENTFGMAKEYMVSAAEDPRAPGGFAHSGAFILIDTQGRIRGYYDGTKPEDTEVMIRDIARLLAEK